MTIEEDFIFRINYQLEGVERSINTSRRALFTLNAIRLSIRDIQQVMSGPTLSNVLWTAIQLTRTLTQARRLTKALAAEQVAAGGGALLGGFGGVAGGAAAGRALAAGQATLTGGAVGGAGFFAGIAAALGVSTLALAGFGGAVGGALILAGVRHQRDRERRRALARNREIAKAQGLEA